MKIYLNERFLPQHASMSYNPSLKITKKEFAQQKVPALNVNSHQHDSHCDNLRDDPERHRETANIIQIIFRGNHSESLWPY